MFVMSECNSGGVVDMPLRPKDNFFIDSFEGY
jgi:hypothetical protein